VAIPTNVKKHNRDELVAFRRYFRMLPKVFLYYAADFALTQAMRPAPSNYSNGQYSGDLMPHNSSNAAWNWRISFSGPSAPLYDINKSPVGFGIAELIDGTMAYEKRSSNDFNTKNMIEVTILTRREIDIQEKLFPKLFRTPYSLKTPSFILYNSIDQLNFGKNYARNANVARVTELLLSYANEGEVLATAVIKSHERSGLFGRPNVEGLLVEVTARSGR